MFYSWTCNSFESLCIWLMTYHFTWAACSHNMQIFHFETSRFIEKSVSKAFQFWVWNKYWHWKQSIQFSRGFLYISCSVLRIIVSMRGHMHTGLFNHVIFFVDLVKIKSVACSKYFMFLLYCKYLCWKCIHIFCTWQKGIDHSGYCSCENLWANVNLLYLQKLILNVTRYQCLNEQ